jgi:hypothetical protein
MAEQNPLAKYQLSRIGGAGRRNTEGMFTNASGNAARDARRAARREQRGMTHAEMQADGIARPAPESTVSYQGPTASSTMPDMSGMFVPDTGATTYSTPQLDTTQYSNYAPSVMADTTTAVPGSTLTENSPQKSQYEAMRSAALANLEAQFGAQRQSLEEDLARRGLSASSFGAGRLGDLAGQQARAMTSLEADLLAQDEQRRQNANDLLIRLATLFGLGNG